MSERAYERLQAHFDLCLRGTVDVKGKGPMPGYLLQGARLRHGILGSSEAYGCLRHNIRTRAAWRMGQSARCRHQRSHLASWSQTRDGADQAACPDTDERKMVGR